MGAPLDPARAEMLALLPRLRRFAHALTGNAADADDLVQDTVERALGHLDRYEPGTRMDSWMFRIAQNRWIDQVRAKRVRDVQVELDAHTGGNVDGREAAETRLMLAAVSRALGELPHEQRSVVALVLIDGMSYREAADILGVPIGTITSRLARARERLAECLSGEGFLS